MRHLLILALAFSPLAACKRSIPVVNLKGLTASETTQEINYPLLFAGKQTLIFTNVISFESSYQQSARAPASSDQGTDAAYALREWLSSKAKSEIFNGALTLVKDFPERSQVNMGGLYKLTAEVPAVDLVYTFHGKQADPQRVKIQFNIVLGPAMSNDYGHSMPGPFRDALADALLNADVATYNGHIWASDMPSDPCMQAPVDDNTTTLVSALGAGRQKYGVIYMNACNGEGIESAMMAGLLGTGGGGANAPLLLSHRNYSNFGFFAKHDAALFQDVMSGQPVQKVMLDMTSTLGHPELANDPRDPFTRPSKAACPNLAPTAATTANADPVAADAAKKLADYYQQSNAYQDPLQVMIVAYDTNGGVLKANSDDGASQQ